jgi:hypothetical protein
MDSVVELHFTPFRRSPNIRRVYQYQCDGREGYFTFDGYYYIHDAPLNDADKLDYVHYLPQTVQMIMKRYTVEDHRKKLEEHTYTVELYKRILLMDTTEQCEGSGEDAITLFPTHLQRVFFHIVPTQSTLCTPCPPPSSQEPQS